MAHSLGMRANILPRGVPRAIPIHGSSIIFSNRQQPTLQQCRPFTQTKSVKAKGGMMSADVVTPKMPPERSFRTKMRDMNPDDIPTDFGILPGTFIKPEAKDMPDFFKRPKDRLLMEWVWIKTWFASAFATIIFHKWQSTPTLPLLLKERRQIGKGLHSTMYTEFARGNEKFLKARCSPGLAKDLIRRIRSRSPKEGVSWTLEKYVRDPSTFFQGARVLSDRAITLPELPDSSLRQIVFRIKSQQVFMKVPKLPNGEKDHLEKGLYGLPRIKNCTEYMVIQKVKLMGRDRDWEIWGFTQPTTFEDLDSPFFATGLTMKERLQGMQDKFAGRS